MSPLNNRITLKADGVTWGGWVAANVVSSIESAARSFALQLSLRYPGQTNPFGFRPFSACELSVDDELVVTGYVDSLTHSHTSQTNDVAVAGRSKTGQLVDCSVIAAPGHWSNKTPLQLAKIAAADYGIEIRLADGVDAGEPLGRVSVEPGESVYEFIERAAQQNALLVTDTADGALLLFRPESAKQSAIALITGENVLEGSGTFDGSQRYSEIRCKGQTAGSDLQNGVSASEIDGDTADDDVSLKRVLIVTADGRTSKARAKSRATWEVVNRIGKSCSMSYKVRGWRQGDGLTDPLWEAGRLVRVKDRIMSISADLLIVSVTYAIDASGPVSQLELAPPGAYVQQEPAKRTKGKITKGIGAWEISKPGAVTLPPGGKP